MRVVAKQMKLLDKKYKSLKKGKTTHLQGVPVSNEQCKLPC